VSTNLLVTICVRYPSHPVATCLCELREECDYTEQHDQSSGQCSDSSCQNGRPHVYQGVFCALFSGHNSGQRSIGMTKMNHKVNRNPNQNGEAD